MLKLVEVTFLDVEGREQSEFVSVTHPSGDVFSDDFAILTAADQLRAESAICRRVLCGEVISVNF